MARLRLAQFLILIKRLPGLLDLNLQLGCHARTRSQRLCHEWGYGWGHGGAMRGPTSGVRAGYSCMRLGMAGCIDRVGVNAARSNP